MFCRECGESIPDDSEYCPECGRPTGVTRPPAGAAASWRPGGPAVAVPNYLVQSILLTIFCCLPAGIVAIVRAAQANSKSAAGDYDGALAAAKAARTWCWLSFGAGIVVLMGYALVAVGTSGL